MGIDAHVAELFHDFPVLGGGDINVRLHRLGTEDSYEAFRAIDGKVDVKRGWVFALPFFVFDEGDSFPSARILVGGVEDRNIVSAEIVHHDQMIAGRIESCLMDGVTDGGQGDFPSVGAVGDFFNGPVIGEAFIGHEIADGFHGGAIDNETASAHAKTSDGVAVAWIVKAEVESREGMGAGARGLAFFDEKFGHGSHLVIKLISFGAVVVVFAVFSGSQFDESDGATLGPSFG